MRREKAKKKNKAKQIAGSVKKKAKIKLNLEYGTEVDWSKKCLDRFTSRAVAKKQLLSCCVSFFSFAFLLGRKN